MKAQDLDMPKEGWRLFGAILNDDYSAATNMFFKLETFRSGNAPTNPLQDAIEWSKAKLEQRGYYSRKSSALSSPAWHMLVEAYWAYRLNKQWHRPHLDMAVQGILEAIPTNAIFFGGTDVGRFAVSAALRSRGDGKSFFAMTQMQLTDGSYLDYLPRLCGTNLNIPTMADLSKVFSTYSTEVEQRAATGTLKPGEGVVLLGGTVYATGIVAVTEVNAQLVRWIFEQNPNRKVFIEQTEQWPVEWTFARSIPRGPVFEILREPVARIDEAVLQADREFWDRWCTHLIGVVIKPGASVSNLCEVVERFFVRNDLKGFAGDPTYLRDIPARNYFGALRHMSAALYLWRFVETKDPTELKRMSDESLLAYEQAFALDPSAAMDFADLLSRLNRTSDACRVLETSVRVNPANADAKAMLERLKAMPTDR